MKAYRLNELFSLNEDSTEWIKSEVKHELFINDDENKTWMFMIFFEKELVVVSYYGGEDLMGQIKGYLSSLTLIGKSFNINDNVMNIIYYEYNNLFNFIKPKRKSSGPTITEEKLKFYSNRIAGLDIIDFNKFSFLVFQIDKGQKDILKNNFIDVLQPWIKEKRRL